VLDTDLFWEVPDLLANLRLGIGWLTKLVEEQSIELLRSETRTVRGYEFLEYVNTILPRGVRVADTDKRYFSYGLEGSLWMVFYEMLSHIRSIQRLKTHQGLELAIELP